MDKFTSYDIETLKTLFVNDVLKNGIYSGKNEKGQLVVLLVNNNGFTIRTAQDNGWYRDNIYEYLECTWIYSETYPERWKENENKK